MLIHSFSSLLIIIIIIRWFFLLCKTGNWVHALYEFFLALLFCHLIAAMSVRSIDRLRELPIQNAKGVGLSVSYICIFFFWFADNAIVIICLADFELLPVSFIFFFYFGSIRFCVVGVERRCILWWLKSWWRVILKFELRSVIALLHFTLCVI